MAKGFELKKYCMYIKCASIDDYFKERHPLALWLALTPINSCNV